MERPLALDPTECKLAIRHLNGTNNRQLNSYHYNNSFTFVDDIKNNDFLKDINLFFK